VVSHRLEGDGTASWYGFLIPDTQSVVSRHSRPDLGASDNMVNKMESYEQEEQRQQEMTNPDRPNAF